MKSKLIVFAMIAAITFFWLPSDSNVVSAQRVQNNHQNRGRHHGRKNTYGHKNYGQYRRTQVGNRRYRTVKRYYWRNGTRLSRSVRVYF